MWEASRREKRNLEEEEAEHESGMMTENPLDKDPSPASSSLLIL